MIIFLIIFLKGLWEYVEARECSILSSGVPVTHKRIDLWYLHVNPHKITSLLVAESQIIGINLSFPQILMESVAVMKANQ